jgi:predicted anti-sigma-YlaC factor YlaD
MSECGSPTARDLLPEYLHERLEQSERASVEAHLAECEDCRSELAMLRSVRHAMRQRTPVIDAAAIVRALPRPPRRRTVRPMLLQLAAALSFISIGGVSLLVVRSFYEPATPVVVDDSTHRDSTIDTNRVMLASRSGLTIGGGVTDLGADELEQLLGALESLETIPSAEPDYLLTQETARLGGVR